MKPTRTLIDPCSAQREMSLGQQLTADNNSVRRRLVNNFVNLNKKTFNEPYLMMNANELLNRVAGGRYITRLDLKSAYFQIPLSKESQKYTGFQTEFGVFSYRMMPTGISGASFTCQRLMDRFLRGTHKYVGTLIDDILVYNKHFDT